MWSALFGRRERFSLEELKYLNDVLQKHPIITDANSDTVVETLRSIAELMIWGDQHEPAFLDFFMEKEVLAHFLRLLKNSKPRGGVVVQVLQTLSIMIQNIRSDRALDYIFREDYINILITFQFDFSDEELLAYYISFLRTISMRLNSNTVKFFIFQKDDGTLAFPLYTEAIRFFHHEESMVRIAVRTLTLNIYNVNEESVRTFILSKKAVGYFSDLIIFLRQRSVTLDSLVIEAERQGVGSKAAIGRLEGEIAETGDLLYYCNDITCAGVPGLSSVMVDHLLNILIIPVLLTSLGLSWGEDEKTYERPGDKNIMSPLCAMYLLSRLLHVVGHKPMLDSIVASLCRPPPSSPSSYGLLENGRVPSKGNNGLPLENGMLSDMLADKTRKHRNLSPAEAAVAAITVQELQLDEKGKLYQFVSGSLKDGGRVADGRRNGENSAERARERREPVRLSKSPREVILGYLRSDQDRQVLAALCVLVALLRNKVVDDTMLDAVGILPRQKLHKQLLLQALLSKSADAELKKILPSTPSDNPGEAAGVELRHINTRDAVDFEDDRARMPQVAGRDDVFRVEARTNRMQVLDALTALLSRRPPPCAEAIWHAGWLLRQLLPYGEAKANECRLQGVNNAYKAVWEDVVREMDDCWCDVLPSVIKEEWTICKRELEVPMLQRDSAAILMPNSRSALADSLREGGEMSSLVVGERMRYSVKVFVALHQLRLLLSDGSVPSTVTLGEASSPPSTARAGRKGVPLSVAIEGEEVELTAGDAMVCRVAFEKGKETAVHLIVAATGASGSLILADGSQTKLGWGVVRVIAPLAGSRPRIDEKHPRWLHLRIRSPVQPPVEAGMLGSERPRSRRLADGRWTLAFADEQRCRTAQQVIAEEVALQSNAVRQVLKPLLGPVPPVDISEETTMTLRIE